MSLLLLASMSCTAVKTHTSPSKVSSVDWTLLSLFLAYDVAGKNSAMFVIVRCFIQPRKLRLFGVSLAY